jgi:4-amino-4-deoxy-L-arabinose transferase-like glycosyltransferase
MPISKTGTYLTTTIGLIKERRKFLSIASISMLGIIIIAAFSLRLWNLDATGLGGDEAVYAGQALVLSGNEEMNRFFMLVSRGTSNFLFHQGIQSLFYTLVGFSDFTTRLVPVVFSVMTVGFVFLIGRELFGKWTALLAAFFMAINGYAIYLGRVGILDSTMTFFFTLSMFFLAKWISKAEPKWLYFLAASAGMAIMTKVVSILIIPIAISTILATSTILFSRKTRKLNVRNVTILSSRKTRKLNVRIVVVSALIFGISLSPAVIEIILYKDTFISFYKTGTSRVINVPFSFYVDKLSFYASIFFIVSTIVGIIISLILRRKGDLQCLIWMVLVLIFFQLQPIKGWNYILPLVPAACILSGRAFVYLIAFLKPLVSRKAKLESVYSPRVLVGLLSIILILIVSYSQLYNSSYLITHLTPAAGLREAADWLKDNASPGDGVMTISHGSAQYIFSLYANIDAYPFGSFNLHTILPGGSIINGPPPPDPLIQNGTVKYFIHYTSITEEGDDPFHMNKTATQTEFLKLVQKYQGHTRQVFYNEFTGLDGKKIKDPRVWIFEVGKRLPEPVLKIQEYCCTVLSLNGMGFFIDSNVNIYYDRILLGKVPTDEMGSFSASFNLPSDSLPCGEELVVVDENGNRKSETMKCKT